jgi:WD40 repeat protein
VESDSHPASGVLLDTGARVGPYEILGVLGKGGMAVVFRARDVRLGRLVALKVANEELAKDDWVQRQLVIEARATASLAHPNVVTLYDVGEIGGRVWVALEYVEGETLSARLKRSRPDTEEAIRIALEIARGLVAAHAAGIAHRDLKPANVTLGTDGRTRVLDFGVALLAETRGENEALAGGGSGAAMLVGTPRYMSPEQWKGEAGPPADVWAFGLLLHTLLTGASPLAKIPVSELPTWLQRPDPVEITVGELHASLIAQCLAKEPTARPDAPKIVRALEELWGRARPGPRASLDAVDPSSLAVRLEELEACVARLEERGLVVVTGPAGSGKTTLVSRELVPRLLERERTRVVQVRPGTQPMLRVHDALESAFPELGDKTSRPSGPRRAVARVDRFEHALRAGPAPLSDLIASRGESTRLVLVLDPLEEILASDPGEAAAFLRAIGSLPVAGGAFEVVLVVRDDALGKIPWGDAGAAALGSLVQLEHPEDSILREVFMRPLAREGCLLEDPTALERFVGALRGVPAPLLHARLVAARLFRARDVQRHLIPRAVTDAIGDPARAVSEHANGLFDRLDSASAGKARRVVLALVRPDRSRARVPRASIPELAGPAGAALLEQLVGADLVAETPEGELMLAHQAYLEQWDRLVGWLDRDTVVSAQIKDLELDAQRWERRGRPRELLLDRARLAQMEGISTDARKNSSTSAMAYLAASKAAHQRRRRLQLALGSAFVAAMTVALVASLTAVWAMRAEEATRARAQELAERDRALLLVQGAEHRLAAEDVMGARALLRTAIESSEVDDVRARALVDALAERGIATAAAPGTTVYAVARVPGTSEAWLATLERAPFRFDLRSGAVEAAPPLDDQVVGVVVLASGAVVFASLRGLVRMTGQDGRVREHRVPLSLYQMFPSFSDDSVLLLDRLGVVHRLSLADGALRTLSESGAKGVEVAGGRTWIGYANGRVDALEADGRVGLTLETGEALSGIAVSPAADAVAVATSRGAIKIFGLEGRLGIQRGIGAACRRVRWVEQTLWAVCGNSLHRLASNGSAHELYRLPERVALLTNLDVWEDAILVSSSDGAWVMRPDAPLGREGRSVPAGHLLGLVAHEEAVFAASAAGLHELDRRDGGLRGWVEMAAGETREMTALGNTLLINRSRELWRVQLPSLSASRVVDAAENLDALATGDGTALFGTAAGVVMQWSEARGASSVATFPARIRDAASFEGGWLLVFGSSLVTFRPGTELSVQELGVVALSVDAVDDGSVLVGAESGGLLRIPGPGEAPETLATFGGRVLDVQAHADQIAVANGDALARLSRPDGSWLELRGHRGEVDTVVFSEGGETLFTSSDDGTVRAWSVATGLPLWERHGFDEEAEGEPAMLEPGLQRARHEDDRCEATATQLRVADSSASRVIALATPVDDLVALPSGCAVLVAGSVFLHRALEVEPLELGRGVSALTTFEGRLWMASEGRLISVGADRAPRDEGEVPVDTVRLLVDEQGVWWGDEGGSVGRLGAEDRLGVDGPRASVTLLHRVGDILLVGRANGTATLASMRPLQPLGVRVLHGAPVAARLVESTLHVLSELGDQTEFHLGASLSDRCSALRELWRASAVVWRDGRIVSEEPAADHPCAR